MPPKTDSSDEVEVVHTNDGNQEKLPLKDRLKNTTIKLFESGRVFIYNKADDTFFGNSSSFWIKTAIYYFFFYVCLGLFYSGMVAVFGAIISREEPRYWYHNSEMNDGGVVYIGMGFRPQPTIDDTLITIYNGSQAQNDTVSSLRNYRIQYLTQYDPTNLQECSPTEPASNLQASRSCQFSWNDIVVSDNHPCSENNLYGWTAGQPCILIKLNKIYGWVPATGDVSAAVANATGHAVLPIDLRENNIYITCNGKETSDQQSIGSMKYYSLLNPLGSDYYGGLPYYFYPYMNSKEHVEPFVLVQFKNLTMEKKIDVQCRAWAPNIQQLSEGTTSRGMVTFTLLRTAQTGPKT
ncbi:unnamed protein product [Adineta ricciae]|uniref:Uncharacterized protein n=1 Tax=Adineta ricciae TaxID=249248 RepID=A0A813RZ13_ADIRI|nr:unnamed protein product [Adineta ricciae]